MRTLILAFVMLAGCATAPGQPMTLVQEPPLVFPDGGAILQNATTQQAPDRFVYVYYVSLPNLSLVVEQQRLQSNVYRIDQQVRSVAEALVIFELEGVRVPASSVEAVTNRLGTAFMFFGHTPAGLCLVFVQSYGESDTIFGRGCRTDVVLPSRLSSMHDQGKAMLAGMRLRA